MEQIALGFLRIVLGVFAEGDQARKGSNERTRTTDIDTDEQCGIIGSELREQDGRGDVTDELTGEDAEQERVLLQKTGEKLTDSGNSRHVAREDEEAEEGCQKTVIHTAERILIKEKEGDGDEDEPDPIGDHTKYNDDGEGEQDEVDDCASYGKLVGARLGDGELFAREEEATSGDQSDRGEEGDEHDAHKLARWDIEFTVEIEVLRISEGREHSAEICSNVLHDKDECHILLLFRGGQNEKSEWEEGQKRHIVADEHRAEERDVNQGKHRDAKISRAIHDLSCKDGEKSDVLQRANNRERAKEAGQRFPIEIIRVLCIGCDDTGCYDREHDRNGQNDVAAEQMKQCR